MSLSDDLLSLKNDAVARFAAANDAAAVEEVRVAVMGRSGRLKELEEGFAAAAPADKRALGPVLNEVKTALRDALKAAQDALAGREADAPIDLTLPERSRPIGTLHPLCQVAREVEQVFTGMGYDIVDGPHIEEDDYNFGQSTITPSRSKINASPAVKPDSVTCSGS